jgi:hypothetical protein
MPGPKELLLALAAAGVVLVSAPLSGRAASDQDPIPPQLPQQQRDNLLRFLEQHAKPDRFIPRDAKLVGSQPPNLDMRNTEPSDKPIKQYTAQIVPHRPVPDQEEVQRVDVYYYRPNPERGKPGITVRHTVDLTTGKQVGATEVLLNYHAPLAREELEEAVALAKDKSPAVQELYKGRDPSAVRWEYLQVLINRKHEPHDPADRVVRLVFTASAVANQPAPAPVRVIVNLTKGVVVKDEG